MLINILQCAGQPPDNYLPDFTIWNFRVICKLLGAFNLWQSAETWTDIQPGLWDSLRKAENQSTTGNLSPAIRDIKGKEMPHKTELTFGSRVKFQHYEGVWALGRAFFCLRVLRSIFLHWVPSGKRGVISGTAQQHLLLGLWLREYIFFDRVILITGTILFFPL